MALVSGVICRSERSEGGGRHLEPTQVGAVLRFLSDVTHYTKINLGTVFAALAVNRRQYTFQIYNDVTYWFGEATFSKGLVYDSTYLAV